MFDYVGVLDISGFSNLEQFLIINGALLLWLTFVVGPLLYIGARAANGLRLSMTAETGTVEAGDDAVQHCVATRR